MSSSSPFEAMSEAMDASFGGFDPQEPADFENFFKQFPEFWEQLAKKVTDLKGRMESEMPIKASVVEEVGEVAVLLNGLRDKADELNTTFRQAHEDELRRANEPRPGEKKWNVPA